MELSVWQRQQALPVCPGYVDLLLFCWLSCFIKQKWVHVVHLFAFLFPHTQLQIFKGSTLGQVHKVEAVVGEGDFGSVTACNWNQQVGGYESKYKSPGPGKRGHLRCLQSRHLRYYEV